MFFTMMHRLAWGTSIGRTLVLDDAAVAPVPADSAGPSTRASFRIRASLLKVLKLTPTMSLSSSALAPPAAMLESRPPPIRSK